MKLSGISRIRSRPTEISYAALLICLSTVGLPALIGQRPAPDSPKVALTEKPEALYSSDPNDSWNRVFYFLFSRRLEIRLSADFPEAGPFVDKVSTRSFERVEIGDRAIDPMYPGELASTGERVVLSDTAYPEFAKALQEAVSESVSRSTIARALMQNDLWGAYDILFYKLVPPWEAELGQRRLVVLDLIARLIKKIALTPEEIKALPNNYSAAVRNSSFPDVFQKGSGWIEVQWFAGREHDSSARFRRVSRVFLKPEHPPRDMQKFLNAQPGRDDDSFGRAANPVADLDGVALVTQLLLIDPDGNLHPTTLTSEAQVRHFEKTETGMFKRTSMQVCEISRKLFVSAPETGGLVSEDENSRAYLGGYTFAEAGAEFPGANPGSNFSANTTIIKPPVQVKLRTRCARCHLDDLAMIRTFAIGFPPHPPPVRQLNTAENDAARFDIAQKGKEGDFQALLAYFDRRASRH
jgi:hypothetical protein